MITSDIKVGDPVTFANIPNDRQREGKTARMYVSAIHDGLIHALGQWRLITNCGISWLPGHGDEIDKALDSAQRLVE